jgi:hypothetical protein
MTNFGDTVAITQLAVDGGFLARPADALQV